MNYPDVSEVLRGETLLREDDTWIRLIHEKQHLASAISNYFVTLGDTLEVGCGTGIYAGLLARAFPEMNYTGIDANPEALAIARRRNPDLKFEQRDFRDVVPLRLRYDLVCAHAFLKHFAIDDWLDLFPRFLALGEVAQFDMQTTTGETLNDGSQSFGNNLWVNERLLASRLALAGHHILSSEVAYEHDGRRATIFLTSRV